MPRIRASDASLASPWAGRRADEGYGVSAEPNWRGVDWRAHLRQAEFDGRKVNYVDIGEGAGDPVVFVHGLGGCWQNWLENLPRIARERRAIAVDLPGFGRSEMPRGETSISGYARCVNELCEQLGLDRVALVGNSMGGFAAAECAIRFPARVERLVLVSAAGITSAGLSRSPGPVVLRIGAALATYGAARSRQIAARPLARHLALALIARHPSRLAPDLVYEGLMRGTGTAGFDDALRATLGYDFRERLPEIACPTLIVWGRDDAVLPARDAEEFERLIPDSRKLVLEDTGHIPQVERPDAFNRCLLEFLRGESVGRSTAGEEAAA